ncbi:MAG: DUF6055 domain-containing protein [Acidobacteriota bacterium]
MLETYKEELLWAFDFLTQTLSLIQPAVLPVEVYVFEPAEEDGDSSPQTVPRLVGDRKTLLSVVLPSRTPVPNPESERAYLRAAAVHEVAHVVCFGQAAFGSAISFPWAWFAEGTAEWLCLYRLRQTDPNNVATFEFLLDWVDYPELSLNQEPDWYTAAMFVDYLVRRYSLDVLGAIWRQASPDNEPWSVIKPLTGASNLFLDFCLDAYALNESAPDLFARFGPRGREYTLAALASRSETVFKGKVRNFGCRYFAIVTQTGSQRFSVAVQTQEERVRAAVLAVNSDYKRVGPTLFLSGQDQVLDPADYPGLDHLAVAVTTEPEQSDPDLSEQLRFELRFKGL